MANSSKSDLEAEFDHGLRVRGIPTPVKEHVFHPTRKWKLDRAWPAHKVAVEIHGGIWVGGRHTRGQGFMKDREKMNEARLHGWTIIEVVDKHLRIPKDATPDTEALAFDWLVRALGVKLA